MMKRTIIKITAFVALLFAFVACDENGEVRDTGVSPVGKLYEPDNGKEVVIQESESASLYFEWEPALAEDGGNALYEVAFDKSDGDFSHPLAIVTADNKGAATAATIYHTQLNEVAAGAGIAAGATGTCKWTVLSSKDYLPVVAKEERTLTITRLPEATKPAESTGLRNAPKQTESTGLPKPAESTDNK